MSADEIRDKVYDIIVSKMGVNKDQIKPESKFSDDLGADSLDTVELIMELENEFKIQIPDEDAEKIGTVQHAIDYIVKSKK
jgi:acyl carrier protein